MATKMTREEAINKVRQMNLPKETMEILEALAPELAESEDERIRKALIWHLKAGEDFVSNGVTKAECLAYLEKQKENPKSADSIPSDCTSDVKCEYRWHKVTDSLPDNPREVLCKDEAGNYFIGRYYVGEGWEISNYDDEDKPHHLNPPVSKWIDFPSEKQKEQKQEKFPPYVTGFKGHPDPAGTSDLEEAAEKYIQGSMCDPDDGPSTGLAKESFIAGAEWQKEQKPAEWSEEDDMLMDELESYIFFDKEFNDEQKLWRIKRLKSLRPSWKPSEEQMKSLDIYRKVPLKHSIDREMLDSLYEQLKKLM